MKTEAEVKAEALREYAAARYEAYLEQPETPWFEQPSDPPVYPPLVRLLAGAAPESSVTCDHEFSETINEIVRRFLSDVADAEETMAVRSIGTGMGIRTTESVSAEGLRFQVEITPEVPYLTIERIVT